MQTDYEFGAEEADNFFAYYGDSEGNRRINSADFVKFRSTFGLQSDSQNFDPSLDFDGNGRVNLADFVQFRSQFGTILDF